MVSNTIEFFFSNHPAKEEHFVQSVEQTAHFFLDRFHNNESHRRFQFFSIVDFTGDAQVHPNSYYIFFKLMIRMLWIKNVPWFTGHYSSESTSLKRGAVGNRKIQLNYDIINFGCLLFFLKKNCVGNFHAAWNLVPKNFTFQQFDLKAKIRNLGQCFHTFGKKKQQQKKNFGIIN